MLHTTLESLRADGARSILVVPVAFVTDHIETVYEIDVEAREQARELGFTQFEIMPALNDSPRLIGALADLVLRTVN
ncbi:MAG: ferrochelatase [Acidobacteria bacterium]|nr:ferrochelatase [Acidobacteriota bacterium]